MWWMEVRGMWCSPHPLFSRGPQQLYPVVTFKSRTLQPCPSHLRLIFSFLFFAFFFVFCSFFPILLSPSAKQRWTAQQESLHSEGPEGPGPAPVLVRHEIPWTPKHICNCCFCCWWGMRYCKSHSAFATIVVVAVNVEMGTVEAIANLWLLIDSEAWGTMDAIANLRV